jgi:Ca2+-transporting ATPase
MRHPPRAPNEPFLPKDRVLFLFAQGLSLALIALGTFVSALYYLKLDLEQARGFTFTVLVLAQLYHAFNNRSERHSLLKMGLVTNKALLGSFCISIVLQIAIISWPPVQKVFGVASLDPVLWVLAVGIGMSPVVMMELWKLIQSLRMNHR